MSLKEQLKLFIVVISILMLYGCFKPASRNVMPSNPLIGHNAPPAEPITAAWNVYKDNKPKLINRLAEESIQYVQYGDTSTLIVPTDKYFQVNSARLNDICYAGLADIIKLICMYPDPCVHVAGFTDNIGTRTHKRRLSQAQAETMLTYLWASGVPADHLDAQGYGDDYPLSNNALIHGSAQNRRIEIQWTNEANCKPVVAYLDKFGSKFK
jgi:outer membrane protein OmpA-like peptidoglycan-associated protein